MFLRRERSRRPLDEEACAATSIVAEDSVPASGSGEADLGAVCDKVSRLQPDLVLLLGPRDWLEPLASCAPRGCWLIDDNLCDAYSAAQALLLPLLRGEPATAIELELCCGGLLNDAMPPVGLATSWTSTCHASASQQCERALRKLPALLLRALRRLSQAHAPWPPAVVATLRLRASPLPAGSGLRALVSTVTARAKLRWQRERQPYARAPWLVAIRTDDSPLDPEHPGISRFQVMAAAEPLGQQIWADPCVVEDGGRRLVFVEECTPEAPRAHIACIEVPEQGPALWLGKVLDRSYHLSFPQVFRWEEQWYMTVESGQAGLRHSASCRAVSACVAAGGRIDNGAPLRGPGAASPSGTLVPVRQRRRERWQHLGRTVPVRVRFADRSVRASSGQPHRRGCAPRQIGWTLVPSPGTPDPAVTGLRCQLRGRHRIQ
jgi:hypothetical protein